MTENPESPNGLAQTKDELIGKLKQESALTPIVILQCDVCGEPVNQHHLDDVGTPFYRCKNGHQTSKPIEKKYMPEMRGSYASWLDAQGNFNPALLAEEIARSFAIKTDMNTDILYFYDSERGVYDKNGDIIVRRLIEKSLNAENRQHRTTETVFLVHGKTFAKIEPSQKVAVENGLLNPETGEITSFTPSEFIVNRLPIRYDKDAKCPEISKFFTEVAPEDLTPQFEEIFGYCLLKRNPIHKATVPIGEGRNGKTTFLNLLTAFLGIENISRITLQDMCMGKFELAELKDKLANICDDLPGKALRTVGTFKWVTGNSPIMAQNKHRNPFTFWPTAKHLFGCNKLPAPSEDTVAYFSRFNIIPFTMMFIGKNDDKEKLAKMTTPDELSGLLNLALAGLKRLLSNGDFTNCKTIEENRQLYIRSSDSCKAFSEDQLEESDDPKDFIATETLYQLYVIYCRDNRLPKIETKQKLAQAMRQTYPNVDFVRERPHGKDNPVWVWRYVKLKAQKKDSPKGLDSFVPSVPFVPPISIRPNSDAENHNIETHGTHGTNGTEPPISEKSPNEVYGKDILRVCGHCFHWRKKSCTLTRIDADAKYDCLSPENPYAEDCQDYMDKEALARGAVQVLNGPSGDRP